MTRTDDAWPGDPVFDDETVDRLVDGTTTDPDLARLAAFTWQVQLLGEQPAPDPSAELAALLRGEDVASAVPVLGESGPARARRRVAAGWARTAGKVAGLGLAAKIGLGTAVAAAGVVGASTTGVLPRPVDDAVRRAIEAVTPLDMDDGRNDPGTGTGTDTDTDTGADADVDADSGDAGPDDPPLLLPDRPTATTLVPGEPPAAPATTTTARSGPAPGADDDQTTTETSGDVAESPAGTASGPPPGPTATPPPMPTAVTVPTPPTDPGNGRPPVPTGPGSGGSGPPVTPRSGPPEGQAPAPSGSDHADQGWPAASAVPPAPPGGGRPADPGRLLR